MKKSLLALAVFGAFAGVASAQTAPATNVTLYGIIDTGVRLTSPTGNNPLRDKTYEVYSGSQSGSRFGLRGSEDLGGGLRAIFNLEGGIDVDTGRSAQGGRLFGRWAYAGLAGNWGEVRLGRQWAAGFEYFVDVDPFATGFGDAASGTTFSSANGLRLDNTVMYRLPNINGFTGMLGYSTNAVAQEVPKLDNNPHVWTAGLRYATGPFLGVFTYENVKNPNCYAGGQYVAGGLPNAGALNPSAPQVLGTDGKFNCADGTSTGSNQVHYQLGATYDFTVVKLHALFGMERHQFALASITPSDKSQSYAFGATVPLAGGSLFGQYQKRKDKSDLKADARGFDLGYTYPLSRRTNLEAYFSDTKASNADVQNAGYQGLSRRQYAFGIRHFF